MKGHSFSYLMGKHFLIVILIFILTILMLILSTRDLILRSPLLLLTKLENGQINTMKSHLQTLYER